MRKRHVLAAVAGACLAMGSAVQAAHLGPGTLTLYDPFLTWAEGASSATGSALTPGKWDLTANGTIHQGNNPNLYDGHAWFFNSSPNTTWAVSTANNLRTTAETASNPNEFIGSVAGYSVGFEVDPAHHQALIGWRTDGSTANSLFRGVNLTFAKASNNSDMQLTITYNTVLHSLDYQSPVSGLTLSNVITPTGAELLIQDVWSVDHLGFGSWYLEIYANGSSTPALVQKLDDGLGSGNPGREYGYGDKIGISGSNLGQGFGTFDAVFFGGETPPPPPVDPTWNVNASGDWEVASNWMPVGVPNGVDAVARFAGAITANRTVFTDVPVTLGTLRFDNANTYLLAGNGTLTMEVSSDEALIDVLQGSHKINLPLHMASDTDIETANGSTLTIADPWTLASGVTVNKNGDGTLTVISTLNAAGPATLKINGGTANFDAANNDPNVTIDIDPATVNLGANQTLGAVALTDGGNVLNVGRNSSGNDVLANLNVGSLSSSGGGTDTLNTTLSANTVTASGAFNVGAGNTLVKNGPGTLTVASGASHAHGAGSLLQIDGGTVNLNSNPGGNLSVTLNSGSLNFGSSSRLETLNIADGQRAVMGVDGDRVLFVTSLNLNDTGAVDLNDNDLIVDYTGASPYADLMTLVTQGFSSTVDPGKTGIVSSTSQAQGGDTILALVDNAAVGGFFTTWLGHSVDFDTVIGKYTYFGDANLDGQVTGDDFALAVSNLGMTGALWIDGDMNFTGTVTGDDLTIIIANLGKGVGNPLGASLSGSAVPEPGALGMLALAGAGALMRRRRT